MFISLGALTASGLLWLWAHYAWGAGAGELPHPLELWMIRLHGLFAMSGLFFFGVVGAEHAARGLRMARQQLTGVLLLTSLAALALSGYALYYFAPETSRPWIGNGHAAVGATTAALLTWHGRWARRKRTRH